MPKFYYQAFDAARKLLADECDAENLQQAIARLESDGLELVSIALASDWSPDASQSTIVQGIAVESGVLRSHMARVLEQGRAIAPALRAYAEEMSAGRRQRELLTVVEVMERGNVEEATAALAKLPGYWIPLLSAATSSRDPARVLREFLHESQQAEDLRRQRWLMVAYPLLIAILSAVLLLALCFFVIPVFRDMLYSFNMRLPLVTKILLDISWWITSGRAVVDLAILAGIIALLWFLKRLFPAVGEWFSERISLPYGRSTAVAQLAHFTADLLESGLSVPASLRVATITIQRPQLRRAVRDFALQVQRPGYAASIILRSPIPATIRHSLLTDVPTDTRIRLLREISRAYADRAQRKLSWTRGIVEPIAIASVGLIVGGTVIALFYPLFNLVTKLSG